MHRAQGVSPLQRAFAFEQVLQALPIRNRPDGEADLSVKSACRLLRDAPLSLGSRYVGDIEAIFGASELLLDERWEYWSTRPCAS